MTGRENYWFLIINADRFHSLKSEKVVAVLFDFPNDFTIMTDEFIMQHLSQSSFFNRGTVSALYYFSLEASYSELAYDMVIGYGVCLVTGLDTH